MEFGDFDEVGNLNMKNGRIRIYTGRVSLYDRETADGFAVSNLGRILR